MLLEAKADVAAIDLSHNTALHFAAHYDCDHANTAAQAPIATSSPARASTNIAHPSAGNVIRHLLSHRAPIDAIDNTGGTALHVAAHHCNALAVRILLQAGADATIANNAGQTPRSAAPAIQAVLNAAVQKKERKLYIYPSSTTASSSSSSDNAQQYALGTSRRDRLATM
jgi:ankyrin repeat protein